MKSLKLLILLLTIKQIFNLLYYLLLPPYLCLLNTYPSRLYPPPFTLLPLLFPPFMWTLKVYCLLLPGSSTTSSSTNLPPYTVLFPPPPWKIETLFDLIRPFLVLDGVFLPLPDLLSVLHDFLVNVRLLLIRPSNTPALLFFFLGVIWICSRSWLRDRGRF